MWFRLCSLGFVSAWSLVCVEAVCAQKLTFELRGDELNPNSGVVSAAAFSPDGALLAVGYGAFLGMLQESEPGRTVLWNVWFGNRRASFLAREEGVSSVAFSPDGKTLAIAEFKGIVRLRDVPSGRAILAIKAPAWIPRAIAFSPDGKWLAGGLWTGSVDGVSPPGNDVIIWQMPTGKPVHRLKGHTDAVVAVAFSPDGKLLASAGSSDGVAKVWDTVDGRLLSTLEYPNLLKRSRARLIEVDAVAFSPDGRRIATAATALAVPDTLEGTAGEVTIWDAPFDRPEATLKGYEASVGQLAFSPDGKVLATAGSDGTVRLWDSASYREIGRVKGARPIAFSPDGQSLASSLGRGRIGVHKVRDILKP